MKTIDQKLTIVRTVAAAAEISADDLRALIHGCGGSPRRAKRVLRQDPALAKLLAEQYRTAIEAGEHHVHAVKACSEQFRAMFGIAAESADAESADADEADAEEADATAEAITPVRTRRRTKPVAEAAAALAALAQPALL